MKKIVRGKKWTILWHVDNLNMSHVDSNIVSRVIDDIDAEYGYIVKMTIVQGKTNKLLGMTIDYFSQGKLILSMVNYIGDMINEIPEDISGESEKSAAHHICILRKMRLNYPEPTQTFFIILWRSYCTCKSNHPQTYSW